MLRPLAADIRIYGATSTSFSSAAKCSLKHDSVIVDTCAPVSSRHRIFAFPSCAMISGQFPMALYKTEPSWAVCMPVARLIATGFLSLTDAFVVVLADAILFFLAIAVVDRSPSGGQVTDTANIDEVRLAYDVKSPRFAEWLPCTV